MRWLAACVLIAGCDRGGAGIDRAKAAALFDRVTLDTGGEHGLSGLAADRDGVLWSVAERGASIWKITLDGTRASTERFAVEGVPRGEDLESIAVAPAGRLVVGTEGKQAGQAHAYTLVAAAGGYQVERTETIVDGELGVAIGSNHGVEGACAIGDTTLLAIESVGTDERGRWAPLVTIDRVRGVRRVQRLRLTTDRGKISALDCWADGDRKRAFAIERHFEVTRILAFELESAVEEIVPRVALDLAPALRGGLNLEGLARLPDGRVVAVVDNQYKTITGPDEILVFRAPIE